MYVVYMFTYIRSGVICFLITALYVLYLIYVISVTPSPLTVKGLGWTEELHTHSKTKIGHRLLRKLPENWISQTLSVYVNACPYRHSTMHVDYNLRSQLNRYTAYKQYKSRIMYSSDSNYNFIIFIYGKRVFLERLNLRKIYRASKRGWAVAGRRVLAVQLWSVKRLEQYVVSNFIALQCVPCSLMKNRN